MGSHKHCQDPACFCVDTVPAKDEPNYPPDYCMGASDCKSCRHAGAVSTCVYGCIVPAKAERRVKVGDAVVNLYPYPLNLFAVAGCGFRVTSATDKSFVAYAGALGMHRRYCDRGVTWDFADPEKPAQPAPDGMSEREREAWELYLADGSVLKLQRVGEWSELSREWQENYLLIRDRAEAIFAAKSAQQCLATQRLCEERAKGAEARAREVVETWELLPNGCAPNLVWVRERLVTERPAQRRPKVGEMVWTAPRHLDGSYDYPEFWHLREVLAVNSDVGFSPSGCASERLFSDEGKTWSGDEPEGTS